MAKGIRNIWIDSDTPESIGNKVIRDGVEIADVLNGIQKYDDPDVVVNRQYKYVIQSYTATGQSTDEVLGDNLNYYTIVEAGDLKPIMTKFRVEDATPNQVHFDTPLGPVTGLTDQGFTVSGANVSAIDDVNNFITLESSLTFWDNNTIMLESGDGTVYDFSMEYVDNQIDEPLDTVDMYVSANGSGDGSDEGNAASFEFACSNAEAGETWWVKAGQYGTREYTITVSGQVNSPIKFKGYTTLIGDLDDDYILDGFDYINKANALTYLNSSKWPLLTGTPSGSSDTFGLEIATGRTNIIIKNIQIENYGYNFYGFESDNIIFENCTCALGNRLGTNPSGGNGFYMGNGTNAERNRFYKCLSFDNFGTNYRIFSSYSLLKECEAYTDDASTDSTDYNISIYAGHHNIVTHCYSGTFQTGSSNHGIGFKSGDIRYSLIVDSHAIGGSGEALYFAHQNTRDCLIKRCVNTGGDSNGMNVRDGAYDCTFESNYIEPANSCMLIGNGTEDEPLTNPYLTSGIVYKNNIFKGGGRMCEIHNTQSGSVYGVDNIKWINNTFYDFGGPMFYFTSNVLTLTNCEFINNIVYGTGSNETFDNDYNGSIDITHCNIYNTQSLPSGVGNVALNPEFNNTNQGGFKPQVTFDLISVDKYDGVNYDNYNGERGNPTAMGAVKHDNEIT